MKLQKILENATNIAEVLPEETLKIIGSDVVAGYNLDLQSRSSWEKDIKKYLELAMQITKEKNTPWPGAANVKYPMISTAAMQFSARAYPTLVPSNGKLVNIAVQGTFQDQQRINRAKNVSTYMSYQILNEMPDWEEGMDNLLLILAIFGIAFKKVYYSPDKGSNCAELVNPFNLVVNYWSKELADCPRISQVVYRTTREVIEKQRAGVYSKVELGTPTVVQNKMEEINVSKNTSPPATEDTTTPYTLIEQHTYLDLDEDGYTEPYIVLVDYASAQVLRITPRFGEEDVKFNADEEVQSIKATEYFVKYSFFPSPDGSFYTRGLGHLLGPLNEATNTLLNQLIDAGTMSNLQGGFIGKGLKIRQGEVRFKPGEWKPVNNLGSDIKQNIFPLPVREPSAVLFQLLGMMISAGKELASVAEIFVGKMPGQNTPAYTTQQTIEQGMKLFTAIYKRVYRSLTKEYRLLYRLNAQFLDEDDYKLVVDNAEASKADFAAEDKDILPSADPTASSDYERQQKFQQVGQLLNLGTISPQVFTTQMLRSFGFSEAEIGELTEQAPATQPKGPSPEEQKMQMDQAMAQQKMQMEEAKMALKQREAEFKMALEQQKLVYEQKQQAMQLQFEQIKQQLDVQAQAVKHKQAIAQGQEKHQVALAQAAQKAKQTPKKGSE